MKNKLKLHFVRMENPFSISIDGKETKKLDIDTLLGDDYGELYEIVDQLVDFVNNLDLSGIDKKKQ